MRRAGSRAESQECWGFPVDSAQFADTLVAVLATSLEKTRGFRTLIWAGGGT